jgi:hypothetical protein
MEVTILIHMEVIINQDTRETHKQFMLSPITGTIITELDIITVNLLKMMDAYRHVLRLPLQYAVAVVCVMLLLDFFYNLLLFLIIFLITIN